MRDFSFIRLKDNLQDALNVDNSPIAQQIYFDTIQLLPNEAYCQITNVDGGISLQSNFTAEIVNCKGQTLKDVTNNIFTEEVLDENGNTQIVFEIININEDFYNEPVLFKFYDDFVEWFSNTLTITEEFKELTSYFEYKNYTDYQGIAYTNSQKYQSIRLKCYYNRSINQSEIEDYYQISRGNTISARVLYKEVESYVFDYLDMFVYSRVNVLLQHEIIYLDGVKLTNKTSFESNEYIDKTNLFEAEFNVFKDYKDKKQYQYQLFGGLEIETLYPNGNYTLSSLTDAFQIIFKSNIQVNTGSLTVYDASDNSVVVSYSESDIDVVANDEIEISGLLTAITTNGNYYILFDSGLFSSSTFGIEYQGISDPTVWTFTVQDADYSDTDYNNDDYLTD